MKKLVRFTNHRLKALVNPQLPSRVRKTNPKKQQDKIVSEIFRVGTYRIKLRRLKFRFSRGHLLLVTDEKYYCFHNNKYKIVILNMASATKKKKDTVSKKNLSNGMDTWVTR